MSAKPTPYGAAASVPVRSTPSAPLTLDDNVIGLLRGIQISCDEIPSIKHNQEEIGKKVVKLETLLEVAAEKQKEVADRLRHLELTPHQCVHTSTLRGIDGNVRDAKHGLSRVEEINARLDKMEEEAQDVHDVTLGMPHIKDEVVKLEKDFRACTKAKESMKTKVIFGIIGAIALLGGLGWGAAQWFYEYQHTIEQTITRQNGELTKSIEDVSDRVKELTTSVKTVNDRTIRIEENWNKAPERVVPDADPPRAFRKMHLEEQRSMRDPQE